MGGVAHARPEARSAGIQPEKGGALSSALDDIPRVLAPAAATKRRSALRPHSMPENRISSKIEFDLPDLGPKTGA